MVGLTVNTEYSLFGPDGSCRDENGAEIRDWFARDYRFKFCGGKVTDKFLFFVRRNTLDNSTAKVKIRANKISDISNVDNSITLS